MPNLAQWQVSKSSARRVTINLPVYKFPFVFTLVDASCLPQLLLRLHAGSVLFERRIRAADVFLLFCAAHKSGGSLVKASSCPPLKEGMTLTAPCDSGGQAPLTPRILALPPSAAVPTASKSPPPPHTREPSPQDPLSVTGAALMRHLLFSCRPSFHLNPPAFLSQ